MNDTAIPCRHCGEKGNRPAAKFCMSCGQTLAPEPVVCSKCGETAATVGARFCNSCGTPFGAAPAPIPESAVETVRPAPDAPPRRPGAAIVKVLLLLAVIGGGFAAYWNFLRIPEPRLVVWSGDSTLEIKVQAGVAVPKNAQGTYSPAPGSCVVTASRQGRVVETQSFTILPGATHVCVVGGTPAEVRFESSPLAVRQPWPGALYHCESCKRLDFTERCGGCSKKLQPLSSKKNLAVAAAPALAEGGPTARALILANPYASDLTVALQGPAAQLTIELAKESVRAVPHAERVQLKCSIAPEGPVLDDRELRTVEGISLYTVGGATWFVWMKDDGTPAPQTSDYLTTVPLEAGARLVAGDPGKPGLLKREAAGKTDRLVSLISLPLVSPGAVDPQKVTVRPGVEVTEVTLTGGLAGKTAESVASGEAGIVVVADGAAYSLSSGERLHEAGPGVTSAAIAADGLFLLTRQGTCATLEGRKLVVGPVVGDPTFRTWAPRDGASVFLLGSAFHPGLFQVTPEGPKEILPATPEVTALGSAKQGVLVARGRTIDRMTLVSGTPKLEPILVLPEGPGVIGLHEAGGPLVFATDSGVYLLADNTVLPLARGIGGALYPCKGGLLLHDRASRRLFRLTSAYFKES